MNKMYCVLMMVLFMVSCNDGDEIDIIGTWKLIEIDLELESNDFQTIDSHLEVTFNTDGTLNANGELCKLTSDSIRVVNGVYSESDFSINTPNCMNLKYILSDDELIIEHHRDAITRARGKYIKG